MSGVIGIPCADQARWSLFDQCVEELIRSEGAIVKRAMGNSLAENNNLIVRYALETGADWVFFLNDDLLFKPDVLVNLLRHPEAIVSGMSLFRRPLNGYFYPVWSQDAHPENGKPWQVLTDLTVGPNGLIGLSTASTGGLLVRTDVFRALGGPYWFRLGQIIPDQWSDDVDFCQRARQAGFSIWGDPAVQFGHMTHIAIWPHQQTDGTWQTIIARNFEPLLVTQAAFQQRVAPDGFVQDGDSIQRTSLVCS